MAASWKRTLDMGVFRHPPSCHGPLRVNPGASRRHAADPHAALTLRFPPWPDDRCRNTETRKGTDMTTKTTTLITTSELAQKMGKDRALRRTVGTTRGKSHPRGRQRGARCVAGRRRAALRADIPRGHSSDVRCVQDAPPGVRDVRVG